MGWSGEGVGFVEGNVEKRGCGGTKGDRVDVNDGIFIREIVDRENVWWSTRRRYGDGGETKFCVRFTRIVIVRGAH